MEEYFSIKTLTMASGMVSVVLALLMFGIIRTRKTYPGFRHWTFGYVCLGAGAILLALRGVLPAFFTIVAANTLIVLLPVMIKRGVCRFLGTQHGLRGSIIDAILIAFFACAIVSFCVACDETRTSYAPLPRERYTTAYHALQKRMDVFYIPV